MNNFVYKQSASEILTTELNEIATSLGAPSAEIDAYFQLRIFSGLLSRVSSSDIESRGILPAYFGVLYALQGGKSLSPTDLRRYVFTGLSNLTTLIDRMVRDGLVRRRRDPQDRRRVLVQLTERGAQVWEKVHPAHYDWVHKTMSALSEKDREALLRILGVLWRGLFIQARERDLQIAGVPSAGNEAGGAAP